MRAIKLPDWVAKLPDNANLDHKEVKRIFGYSEKTGTSKMVENGSLPKPTMKQRRLKSGYKYLWSVKSLKELVKAQENNYA